MPMPIGGALGAIAISYGAQRRASQGGDKFDPELERFREQQKYIKDNLKCTIDFGRRVIPPKGGKVEGMMVLEAEGNVEHSGLFILMKGIQQVAKRKSVRKPQLNVKFNVLGGSTLCEGGKEEEEGGERLIIQGGSQETYPLSLDIPSELPPPFITSQGKLIYKMRLFVSTSEGKHVGVGEVPIRWRGCRILTMEEMEKPLRIEQQVTSKRGYLGLLGRKKCAEMEWRMERGGYLPGDVIPIQLLGETKESAWAKIDCRVELVQKVWYQVRSITGSGQMWAKMKINLLTTAENEDGIKLQEAKEKVVLWRGELTVPRGITPTYRHNFSNSISYTIRASCGLVGENRDDWVVGEVPVLIGCSKEEDGNDEENQEEVDLEDDEEIDLEEDVITSKIPPEVLKNRRGSGGPLRESRRSRSLSLIRPRSGSVSSTESVQTLASSTLSMFRMPPSYSQLSSRRPTQETLPPAYWELELQEQCSSLPRQSSSPAAPFCHGSKSEIDDEEGGLLD